MLKPSPMLKSSRLILLLTVSALFLLMEHKGFAQEEVALRHLGGRWFVLEGNYKAADLDRLGIASEKVRKNAAFSERGTVTQPGLLLYQAESLIDPFSENYGDTNNDSTQDLTVTYASDFITIHSQCLPNHPHGTFPNTSNPNTIQVQNLTYKIPVNPVAASQPVALPMGPTGVALNGVVLYNQSSAEAPNAVKGSAEEFFDSCCGHPDGQGMYHYHKYPRCVKSPFIDKGDAHSPIIGYAWDGYAVYGPYEAKDLLAENLTGATALDSCNGHTDATRGYHYHVTPDYSPYIIAAYHGVPNTFNNSMINLNNHTLNNTAPTGADRFSGKVLTSFSPSTLQAGQTYTVTLGLTTTNAQPPVPPTAPTLVHVGRYEATNIARNGNTITAQVVIPADAPLNVYDVHIEFAAPAGAPNQLPPVYRIADAALVLSKTSSAAGAAWRLYPSE